MRSQKVKQQTNKLAVVAAYQTNHLAKISQGASLILPRNAEHLLGKSDGRDATRDRCTVVIRLRVGPIVLGQGADVLDVLSARRVIVEYVVIQATVDAGVVGVGCGSTP